ncbi:MAG: CapA family protein [Clostridia bacterium]|nr:CapA family protein [Clostridia bacterium]NLS85893.1 CapA family protein [Oscillospiraceae bacterium]
MNNKDAQHTPPPRKRRRRRRKINYKRFIPSLIILALLFAALIFGVYKLSVFVIMKFAEGNLPQNTPSSIASSVIEEEPQPTVQTVRFSCSGDDLIHDGLYMMARKRTSDGTYNFVPLYENVASYYKNFDVNWINQETLVSDEISPSGYPCFCSPGNVAHTLYDIGFRVFAMSNNHSYDQGAAGIASTLDFWSKMPDDVTYFGYYKGAEDYSNITVQEVNGIKIAYLAYTEHTNGLNTPSDAVANVIYTNETDVIEQQMQLARSIADVVIPCVHMGTENSHDINDAQTQLAQQLTDWGADVIIGTHPHVVQPIEYFTAADTGKKVPFFYCLGNFVSLQQQADNLVGIIGSFNITKTTQPTGESEVVISDVKAEPIVMYYNSSYTEGQVYLLKDYTDEIAAKHSNRAVTPAFARQLINEYIDDEFLNDEFKKG